MISLREIIELDPAIEDAARKNGYNIGVVYHGTDAPKFTTFKRGLDTYRQILFTSFKFKSTSYWFTENYEDAKQYGRYIMPCFLKLKNRLPTLDEVIVSSSDQNNSTNYKKLKETLDYIFSPIIESGPCGRSVDLFITNPFVSKDRADDGDDILYYIGSSGLYDWSVFDNEEVVKRIIECGYDHATAEERQHEVRKSYAVFHANLIKLAKPTYDDNGNLISLTDRFDDTKEDIRY